MSGLVWDFQSAARISRAVRKVEQTGQSQFDEMGFSSTLGGSRDWVKTPSTLPGGYDGTEPLSGSKVVRLPNGTIHTFPQSVFILDPNGTPLAADTIYPAQFAGTYEDAGTTQGLYLVQAGGSANGWTPPTFCFLRYNGGGYTGTGSGHYTTCQYVDTTSGSAVWTNISVRNGDHGPLFHAATNTARTTWGVPGIGSPTFFGVAVSGGSVENRCIPLLAYPARFRLFEGVTVSGEIEFQIKSSMGASGTYGSWFLATKDTVSWGAVGRFLTQSWTDTTSSGGNVTSVLDNTRTRLWNPSGEPQIYGTPGPEMIGIVGYNLNMGWHVLSINEGLTSAGNRISYDRLGW